MKTRFLGTGDGTTWEFHHVVSRVVDRRLVFGDVEKRFFRDWVDRYARFCGMEVVTYCLMGNHFHLLIGFSSEEADRFAAEASDDEVVERARAIYERDEADVYQRALEGCRVRGDDRGAAEIRGRLTSRMGNLSIFVQELKRRFSKWYNGRNDRVGTLWESRFRSVLVEGDRVAMETVAGYIDLNPVRAGMVSAPEDYRFCGYGEAVGAASDGKGARRGIARAVGLGDEAERDDPGWWDEAQKRYRLLLFGRGVRSGSIAPGKLREVIDAGGALTRSQALHCRIRFMTDGGAIGSTEFVEAIFARERADGKFSPGRTTGSRPMGGAEWGGLTSLRDLRKSPITVR